MKNNYNKGFTLIELLVVVLIIGILSAVALPQYQKAVIKTKLTQLTTTINALTKGIDLYILSEGWPAGGTFLTDSPNPLDIEIPGEYNSSRHMYVSKIGGVQASVAPDGANILYQSSEAVGVSADWFDLTVFEMSKTPETNRWVVTSVDSGTEDYMKIICQWFKGNGYPANGTVAGQCREVGVTLEQI